VAASWALQVLDGRDGLEADYEKESPIVDVVLRLLGLLPLEGGDRALFVRDLERSLCSFGEGQGYNPCLEATETSRLFREWLYKGGGTTPDPHP
jgi:hypothetical protein